jgi:hypothetical protein
MMIHTNYEGVVSLLTLEHDGRCSNRLLAFGGKEPHVVQNTVSALIFGRLFESSKCENLFICRTGTIY